MMKLAWRLSDPGLCWKHCPPNLAAAFSILCLVLGLMVTTVTSSGCGQSSVNQRVVGGKNSVLGKWPWQVSLMYDKIHVCGGSLIYKTWVLSAAHCMNGRDPILFFVTMGVLNLTGQITTRTIIPVKNVFIPTIYNGDGTSGDLALIELESPVTFTNTIQPICLPSPDQHFPDGTLCWLVGWGNVAEYVSLPSPYTLQEVDLPLINSSACDEIFRVAYSLFYPPEIIKDDMICAGYPDGGKDGCQGDSGGPLACQVGNSWLLVGVVSWGDGCAEPGRPGVYTKVSSFISWIQSYTKINATVAFESNVTTTVPPETKVTATTDNVNTVTVQKQSGAVQNSTYTKDTQEDLAGAGLRPHVSQIVLVVVVLISRIVDFSD